MTDAEHGVWQHLRAHRFMGLKFKRQKPLGRYIVGFVCLEISLIIELDGGQHAQQQAYDQRRDRWLQGQGFTVMRFWNHDVLLHMDAVLEQVRLWAILSGRVCVQSGHSQACCVSAPSPAGGRGLGRGW